MGDHSEIRGKRRLIQPELEERSVIAVTKLSLSHIYLFSWQGFSSLMATKAKKQDRIAAEPPFILAINNTHPWSGSGGGSLIHITEREFPVTFYTY